MPPRGVKKGTKRERQYEAVKESVKSRGASTERAEEIAARTVNKERARSRSPSLRALVQFMSATAVCLTTCTTDAECTGTSCMNGSCIHPPRETCVRDQDCASNHCAQGACCNTACDGVCMACNLTGGREGSCSPRPSGTDCGHRRAPQGMATGLKRCDTAGTCVAWAPEVCAPFTCDPVTQLCRTGCAGDVDCAATYTCAAGSCGRRDSHTCDGAPTSAIRAGARAAICCDAACDDPCHTCSLPG